ncbi:hypothetical protein [Undibacterium sp.]|uniref:hypothetical protein n=1 Tax=Undibacterium sp. TaxID=1914977 RepID=UPI00374DBEB3
MFKSFFTCAFTCAAAALAVGLAGCGDKAPADTPGKPSLADATSQKTVAAAKQVAVQSNLPKANRDTPMDSFVEYSSGNQLMFAYLALNAVPIDYKEVLNRYSMDYARQSDEFKKNDLLTALKPKIDAEVDKAKSQRYVKMFVSNPIEKFDFEKKGFPVSESIWQTGSYRYFSDNAEYKIGFTNGDGFRYLKPASEEDARKIEEMRSKYVPLQMAVYCYLQDADISNKTIKAEIIKITLVDKNGNVLASQ